MPKDKNKTFEKFPLWMIWIAFAVCVFIYALGAYVLLQVNFWIMILYLFYCLLLEVRLLKKSCVNCYYYGKLCCLGRGKVCSWFFKKGNPKNFCKKNISWKDLIPDFLVSIIPLIAGIILLIVDFQLSLLIILILLFLFSFFGNSIVRSKFACKYCKQRELGCPAEKLFSKKK